MAPHDDMQLADVIWNDQVVDLAAQIKLFEKGKAISKAARVTRLGKESFSLVVDCSLHINQRIGLRIEASEGLLQALGIDESADSSSVIIKSMGEVLDKSPMEAGSGRHCYSIRFFGPFSIVQAVGTLEGQRS